MLGIAFAGYALTFGAFILFEKPGLGVGHFYYLCVALVALSVGPLGGGAAGPSATTSSVAPARSSRASCVPTTRSPARDRRTGGSPAGRVGRVRAALGLTSA
jgi:hypothetical protein